MHRSLRGSLHSLASRLVTRHTCPPSPTPSPLNQRSRTPIRSLHVVYCASNIFNILHFQHPIDHRCLGRLCKHNWNRPFQKSLRCLDRRGKFSRGHPRTAPRTREGIQRVSRRKSEINQLPQPGGEGYRGLLRDPWRGGHPGEQQIPSSDSLILKSPGPLPTSEGFVCRDRCSPRCTSPECAPYSSLMNMTGCWWGYIKLRCSSRAVRVLGQLP